MVPALKCTQKKIDRWQLLRAQIIISNRIWLEWKTTRIIVDEELLRILAFVFVIYKKRSHFIACIFYLQDQISHFVNQNLQAITLVQLCFY